MKATPVRRRFGRVLAATAAAALVVGGGAAAASAHKQKPVSLAGLKVLLTNDDSMQAARPNNSDGLGLFEVRKALCAVGADVVVIAPWQVQSGRGTAVSNSGTVRLATKALPAGYENDCSGAPTGGLVYGLCLDTAPCGPTSPSATPVDTIKFATRGGLAAVAGWHEPDLVVSGSNSGLNVANSVNDSGTVAATVAAIEGGIPAVAFSSSATADFASFPVANYRATAQWGARFLIGLRAKGLLDQHAFALGVNYPNVAEGARARSAVWASVGTGAVAWHSYALQADGSYTIGLALCTDRPDCIESRSDADAPAVMKRNRITVVPVGWDRTYGLAADSKRLLGKVRAYVERQAPAPVNP